MNEQYYRVILFKIIYLNMIKEKICTCIKEERSEETELFILHETLFPINYRIKQRMARNPNPYTLRSYQASIVAKQLVNAINEPLKSNFGKNSSPIKRRNERRKFLIDAHRKRVLDSY